MPHYRVQKKNDAMGDCYWVLAASPTEARRLIALNVSVANGAENINLFMCEPSETKMPAAGVIYCRLTGPLAIEKR
jgi:hypothetical protein